MYILKIIERNHWSLKRTTSSWSPRQQISFMTSLFLKQQFLFSVKHFRVGTRWADFHWLNQSEITEVWLWCHAYYVRKRKYLTNSTSSDININKPPNYAKFYRKGQFLKPITWISQSYIKKTLSLKVTNRSVNETVFKTVRLTKRDRE